MRKFFSLIAVAVIMAFATTSSATAQIMSNPFESFRVEVGPILGAGVPNTSTPNLAVGIHGDTGFDIGAVIPVYNKLNLDFAFGGSYQKAGITSAGAPLGKVTSKTARVSIRTGFDNAWGKIYAGGGARYIDVGGTLGGGNLRASGNGIYPMVEVGVAFKLPAWIIFNIADINFSHSRGPLIGVKRFDGIHVSNIKYNANVVAFHLARSF